MNKLTTLFLVAISSSAIAQIPNPSFENWTSGMPNNWHVSSLYFPGNVTQSANAHAGVASVQLNSVLFSSQYFGVVMQTGSSKGYFANTTDPVALNGWYILNASGGDELVINIKTKCPSGINGGGNASITTSTPVYKQFSICLNYNNSCTADSASISLGLMNTGGYTHAGSYAIIDDLSFGTCVNGINEVGDEVKLEPSYPNPASTMCNIIYSIPLEGIVNIAIYDISGRKMRTLVDDIQQSTGRYKIPVDVSSFANGIYVYVVRVNGQSYAQKLTVAR